LFVVIKLFSFAKVKHISDYQNQMIQKATLEDIDELETLYNELNDHFSLITNYPGWIKGIYPVRQTAIDGIEDNSLFVCRVDGKIAGSVILNHHPEEAYHQVQWQTPDQYQNIFVIHTLVVHPYFFKQGIGEKLMDFAKQQAIARGIKSIRLDVSVNNMPAIRLYEKMEYKYVGTVDLGLEYEHLKWFRLYELAL